MTLINDSLQKNMERQREMTQAQHSAGFELMTAASRGVIIIAVLHQLPKLAIFLSLQLTKSERSPAFCCTVFIHL